ncbi:hypothetical protein [Methanobrevibacter sp.]|uniref:hypothetical protein n=1 Tax=Methanobrevibacter sp. TaxID=66852 RepID=UPI00388ED2B8
MVEFIAEDIFSNSMQLTFENITDLEKWNIPSQDVKKLDLQITPSNKTLSVWVGTSSGSATYTLSDANIVDCSENQSYIIFTCDIPSTQLNTLLYFIQEGYIEVNQKGKTTLFVFRQNSPNNYLSKNLINIDAIDGKFNQTIGLKNINVDIKAYSRNFNYVYIPIFNRYYYVDSIEFISADYTRLHLKEDVLMSWKTLIRLQNGYILRSSKTSVTNPKLIDDRFPTTNILEVDYLIPRPTTTGSLVNCYLDFSNISRNILVTTNSSLISTPQNAPDYPLGLPEINGAKGNYTHYYLMTRSTFNTLRNATFNNDVPLSFITSAIWLPFNTQNMETNVFKIVANKYVVAGDYALYHDVNNDAGQWFQQDPSQTPSDPWVKTSECTLSASPYFITNDFVFTINDPDYLSYEPYTNYEIYVAFVGWVSINANQLINKRILLYYSIDFDTGNATAFLYNYTDYELIWSGTCLFGFKLPITSSNAEEITREKQNNALNLTMGLVSGSLAVIGGIASENVGILAKGGVGLTKSIISYANAENTMYKRGVTAFGSSENALHVNSELVIKISHYNTLFSDQTIFNAMNGKPYKKYEVLSNHIGYYIEVPYIHFDPKAYSIYQDEISEIVELLHNGVNI